MRLASNMAARVSLLSWGAGWGSVLVGGWDGFLGMGFASFGEMYGYNNTRI